MENAAPKNPENISGKEISTGIMTYGALFLFTFLSSIIILRILGPQQAGVFFLFVSLNQMVATILCLGLPNANTMLLGKSQYSFNQVNSNSLLFSGLIGAFCLVIYLALQTLIHDYLIKEIEPRLILLSVILIPFTIYGYAWNAMMVGVKNILKLNKFLFWQGLASFVLVTFFLILIKPDIYGAVIAWTLVTVFSPFAMVLIGNKIESFRPVYNHSLFKETVSFGLQIHLGGIATMIWQRIDAFILNYYYGSVSVGYYSLAVNLTEMLWKVIMPINNAVNATITGSARKYAGNITAVIVRQMALILSILGLGLGLASPLIVRYLYGVDYMPAVKPLLILIIGTVSVGIVMITAIYFANNLKKPLFLSGLAWVNAIVNILLCFILIPGLAENGAAGASTITYFFGFMVIIFYLRKETNLKIKDLLLIKKEDLNNLKDFLKNSLKAKNSFFS